MAGILLGQPEQASVLGHVVVVGVGVGCVRVRRVGIGTIVSRRRMRHPRIGGIAGVRRRAIQVANLQMISDRITTYLGKGIATGEAGAARSGSSLKS